MRRPWHAAESHQIVWRVAASMAEWPETRTDRQLDRRANYRHDLSAILNQPLLLFIIAERLSPPQPNPASDHRYTRARTVPPQRQHHKRCDDLSTARQQRLQPYTACRPSKTRLLPRYAKEPPPNSRCSNPPRNAPQDGLRQGREVDARTKRGMTARPQGDSPEAPVSPNFQGWLSKWTKNLRLGWNTPTKTDFSQILQRCSKGGLSSPTKILSHRAEDKI